jgi:hypothetical protein
MSVSSRKRHRAAQEAITPASGRLDEEEWGSQQSLYLARRRPVTPAWVVLAEGLRRAQERLAPWAGLKVGERRDGLGDALRRQHNGAGTAAGGQLQ